MKSFEINLLGENYAIYPIEGMEDYQIAKGNEVLGTITPSTGYAGVKWTSMVIDNDLAQQIGELIEEHDM